MRNFLTLLLICIGSFSFACQCPVLAPLNKATAESYDVVFYGHVDSVSPCNTQGLSTAWFTIDELYRGSATKKVGVDFECNSSCMMSFAKGDVWLMYTSYIRFDLLKAEMCGHSRQFFKDRSQDIYFINSQRSFEDERSVLTKMLGLQKFAVVNELNEQPEEMKPTNIQPSAMGKLWLLLVSLAAMIVVYYFSNRRKKK
jgi:hypothetical protein